MAIVAYVAEGMAVRLRAAWAAAGALWAGQLAGVIASPNLMSPAADMLLDTATACLTLALIGWNLLDRAGLRPAVTRAEYDANRAEVEAFKRAVDRVDHGIADRSPPLTLVRKDAAN